MKFDEKTFQFLLGLILNSHFVTYKEVEVGNGRIDFLIMRNINEKTIIETKMVRNKDFINGINQLEEYMKREKCKIGFFVVIYNNASKINLDITQIKNNINERKTKIEQGYRIIPIIIDVSYKKPPSKLDNK